MMKVQVKTAILIAVSWSSLTACQEKEPFDRERATAEIMALHNAQRDYHFNKDSVSFVDQLSADFIAVNRGIISSPTREENLGRYNTYFSAVEFVEWDDVQKPVIRFSSDGTLAYTVVDKIVKVRYPSESGTKEFGETHFAWVAIYRKTENGWKIESAISTNKPIAN